MTAGGLSLSLHVLDTVRGRPAAGLAFALWRIDNGSARTALARAVTDEAGRWSAAAALPLALGVHELVFDVAAYHVALGAGARPPFYDLIPIRFRMEEAGGHYHIPLILSPFGYSTYRGG